LPGLWSNPYSAREVADRLGVTARTVRNARARLIAEGYFEIVDPGHGRGRKPVYQRIEPRR
jgi:predicted ArsR family transcriptional regulator